MSYYGASGHSAHRRQQRQHHVARRKARSKSHVHRHGYHLKHPRKKGLKHP